MKKKKNKRGIIAALPEAMILLSIILSSLSFYFVFMKKTKDFYAIALLVSSALAAVNFAILFVSLRKGGLLKGGPNDWARIALSSLGLFIAVGAFFALNFAFKTSYAAAQMMLGCGSGLAIIFIIGSIYWRKSSGLKRELFAKIRVWHISIVLYCIVAAATWFIADWNPTLRHYSAKLQAKKVRSHDFIKKGDICEADIGTYPTKMKIRKCRVRFFCGGKRLFGVLGGGMIKCRYRHGERFFIVGEDPSADDGDPALRVNTRRKLLQYSSDHSLRRKVEAEFKIIKIEPFTFPDHLLP